MIFTWFDSNHKKVKDKIMTEVFTQDYCDKKTEEKLKESNPEYKCIQFNQQEPITTRNIYQICSL